MSTHPRRRFGSDWREQQPKSAVLYMNFPEVMTRIRPMMTAEASQQTPTSLTMTAGLGQVLTI